MNTSVMTIDEQVRACVKSAQPYQPGKPIDEVKRELGLSRVYKMASNENALGPSPLAVAAMRRALSRTHRYPDGACYYLKQALSRQYGVAPERIVVGNGSDELIVLAARALLEPGDEVIIAAPTFLVYKIAAHVCGATPRFVPLRDFQYDLPAMADCVTARTKIIFIANPDNPTGSYVNAAAVDAFIARVPLSVLIFFDEAYFEYVRQVDYPRTHTYLERGNVAVSRSFSKAYGLGGMRVGWLAASAAMADYLNRVREPFNVNSLAQEGACAALQDSEHLRRSRELADSGRAYVSAALRQLGLRQVFSVTNFVLFEVGATAPALYRYLLQRGLIVREMTAWGLPGFLRVTVGREPENRMFVTALRRGLRAR